MPLTNSEPRRPYDALHARSSPLLARAAAHVKRSVSAFREAVWWSITLSFCHQVERDTASVKYYKHTGGLSLQGVALLTL